MFEYRLQRLGRIPVAFELNQRGLELWERMAEEAESLRVRVHEGPKQGRLIDLGINVPGGLEAGRRMAEVALAGLGQVTFVPAAAELGGGPAVMVRTDHPVAACMASQYAGWKIATDDFFAMGSGPMRAAAAVEELFQKIGHTERAEHVVGMLETRQMPGDDVWQLIAEKCGVAPSRVHLLAAPTASQAGTVQVVARSVETALHKLWELGFDLTRIESGWGVAPLPPVAGDDLAAIGRTNDAILYGGNVTLWVRGDDDSLEAIGPDVPSSASPDYGRPFADVFAVYDQDFYRIDPQLFSPAQVTLVNLDTGNSFRFGELRPDVIRQSFGS